MTAPLNISATTFNPPLTDKLLKAYRKQIDALPKGDRIRDALDGLYNCVAAWWELPESERPHGPAEQWVFPDGKTREVRRRPLEEAHIKALWDKTPWMDELLALGGDVPRGIVGLFEQIADPELAHVATHLLWFCKELTLDREPTTTDRL